MTTLTMIWNDCHSAGVSDHHWHTMEYPATPHQLRQFDRNLIIRIIMADYYAKDFKRGKELADVIQAVLPDYGLVGIFIGIPEEL